MNLHDKHSLITSLQNTIEYVKNIPVPTPCSSCIWFVDRLCKKAQMQPIPAEVLPQGCPEFEFDWKSPPF